MLGVCSCSEVFQLTAFTPVCWQNRSATALERQSRRPVARWCFTPKSAPIFNSATVGGRPQEWGEKWNQTWGRVLWKESNLVLDIPSFVIWLEKPPPSLNPQVTCTYLKLFCFVIANYIIIKTDKKCGAFCELPFFTVVSMSFHLSGLTVPLFLTELPRNTEVLDFLKIQPRRILLILDGRFRSMWYPCVAK